MSSGEPFSSNANGKGGAWQHDPGALLAPFASAPLGCTIAPVEPTCALCQRARDGALACENGMAVAFDDGYPVSRGHTLIVPRRHVADLFALSCEEQQALWALLPIVKEALDRAHRPAGYNVGVNVGQAAGQTIAHVHVHVIPRYHGDVTDPRGGVRWVIPDLADYWSAK